MSTKKEDLLNAIETAVKKIKKGDTETLPSGATYTYQSTLTYVDRQYIAMTVNEVKNSKMPWCIINNEKERFETLVGGAMENKVILHVVGFVKVIKKSDKLDTLMNNLQKDILVAILKDETVGGTCDFIYPIEVNTVPTMIFPYGGFVITLEATYSCDRLEF